MITRLLAASALAFAVPLHAAAPEPDGIGTDRMVFAHHGNAAAGAPFLRGLALLHSFEYDRAAAEFRAAQAADPDWVLPYWGEAMTHNHPLWAEQDADAARAILARLGDTSDARAAKLRGPDEARWLAAIETLYGEGEKEARDDAYAAAMETMLAADPADIDVRAFAALSVLGTAHEGRDTPTYMRAAAMLEEGFLTHPMHPGVLHYLIHSYDDPAHAPLGLRAARRYAGVAPDAGHAQHMVSHIFNGMGMWEEAEAANINAVATVNRQRAAEDRPPVACGHYNEWLVYALLQQGKDASGLVDACRAQVETALAGGKPGPAWSYSISALREGATTGRWPAPLDFGDTPEPATLLPRFFMAYGQALAARRDPAAARAAIATMEPILATLKAEPDAFGEGMSWMERIVAQSKAVALLAEGRTEDGLAALAAAGATEAALPVIFGPPMMARPSDEILGDELAALGRTDEARAAYTRSLLFAPGRLLTMQGLEALDD